MGWRMCDVRDGGCVMYEDLGSEKGKKRVA